MAVVASVATAVTAVGAGLQYNAAKKATRQGKKANKAQRAINRLKNKQNKRQFLRSFRQAQASTLVAGVAAGVGLESSQFQGTLGSQRMQAEQAVEEFAESERLGTTQMVALNKQSSAQGRAAGFGSVANIASSFISFGMS